MSSGGGGNNSQTALGTWSPALSNWWAGSGQDGWEGGLLQRAGDEFNRGYVPYGGERVADLDPLQREAQAGIRHTIFGGGAADTEAAREQNRSTASGEYLPGGLYGRSPGRVSAERISAIGENPGMWENSYTGTQTDVEGPNQFGMSGQNPYSQNRDVMGMDPYGSAESNVMGLNPIFDRQANVMGLNPVYGQQSNVMGLNPFANSNVSPESNQYMGDSPYFRSVLQQGQQDITDAYNQGVSADTTRAFNLAGAFGGGAHERALERNQNALGRQLGNFQSQMANQQYDRSAGLREADISRRLGAGQFNAGQGFSGFENLANRSLMGSQADLGRNAGLYENLAGRTLQGSEGDLGRSGSWYENLAGRTLAGSQGDLARGSNAYADLARRTQGQGQFDASLGSQNWENQQNRGFQGMQDYANQMLQAGMFDRGMGNQNIENRLNRQQTGFENAAGRDLEAARFNSTQGLGAQQFNEQMGQGAWDSERNRMMQGSGMGLQGQGLSFDAFNQLGAQGALNRGITQQRGDIGYQNFLDQQGWGRNQIGWLANLLSQAGGTTGQTTTTQYGNGGNLMSQLGGLGLLGASMWPR